MAIVLKSTIVPLVMLMLMSFSAEGVELAPFATRNQNPLTQIFGLPTAESSKLLSPGETSVTLTLDLGNSYAISGSSREAVVLDGETTRTHLSLRYGLQKDFEIGLDLPYISHNGGFLDGFIENWHQFFNLPDGDRDQTPRDRLEYSYQRNGKNLVQVTEDSEGIGDLRLSVAWQLVAEDGPGPGSAALRLGLKLPTGDSDRLFGSGSTDLSLAISGQRDTPVEQGTMAAFASLGLLLMSKGEVLKDQQKTLASFGSLGIGWSPNDWIGFKLQLDGHTALYKNSNLAGVGKDSGQLAMGGTLKLAERTTLDLAVVEDVVVDTAPDVVFHLSLRTVF